MNREELKRSGLLDQYVLGLLGPERMAEVEQLMREDPFLEQEVERLREDLNAYADSRNIGPPPPGREARSAEDFQDLDHEMITAMMEHNHTLNIWRYVLIAIIFLLVFLSGYLFRLKENVRGELITERALHAQDDASHRLDMERSRAAIEAAAANWENLTSIDQPMDTGTIHVHVLAGVGVALVDLSDVPPPPVGHAYYIFSGADTEEQEPEIVSARQLGGLYAVKIAEHNDQLRIYQWVQGRDDAPRSGETPIMIVDIQVE
ncbi:hypothetical protein GGR28_002157 [Lewinella aquimaris]|uniref:Anti-sigma factor n=1 Tax=Neolewinella aquimaris TaxID=1835722 RepID=A0A840E722_9BACT|nr:hypothetical protein [Neolewinella aquimaris]MBB4079532.1 hypothetical protein [Neolewinella aquimaris]